MVIKKRISLLFVMLACAMPSITFAVQTGLEVNGKTSFTNFMGYMANIFAFSLKAGAVLTTIMVIYAGYVYMTSQGNPTALGQAKDIIAGSLTGFVLLLLIFFILKVFNLPAF